MRTATLALLAGLATTAFQLRDTLQAALSSITADELRAHVQFLSHDLLEGRAPATRGGELAALYIATQFARAGLEPVKGSYFQEVPVVGITADKGNLSLEFEARGRSMPARYPADAVIWTAAEEPAADVAGELVFVGYGARAPEYRWDDFKGRDLGGKILLVLVNDPPAPPEEPALFGGRAMTYYGRWTYKFEEAERQGAAGALLLHTRDGAGYPWSVVESSWGGEQFALPREPGAPPALALEGWIQREFARRLLVEAGHSLEELYVLAARRDFRPIATGITVHARIPSRIRHLQTANVAGLLPGQDPERRDEIVVYTAHYDHLGIGTAVSGDSIYNGAYDNASGVGLLLEVADAFAHLSPRPDRSVLFLATAAEEAGLLGAAYYVQQPLFPIPRTMANINIDGANLWGETRDVVALGAERSTLGRIAETRARQLGLRLTPDRAPEKGFFFRSDHFPFARAGVPALYLEHGLEFKGRPAGWGLQLMERYDAERYHQPSDEFDAGADLGGAIQQARLAFLVGYDVAQARNGPEWYDGSEFKAVRDRSLRRRAR
ncbi:MAG: M28 family peptidase [Gemmatimonadetes bacterium]|nr:M28 family peptidase [Gemmatimonadota bacterium]